MSYHTVFDVEASGIQTWGLVAWGALLIVFGAGAIIGRRRVAAAKAGPPPATAIRVYGFLAFALVWTGLVAWFGYRNHAALLDAVHTRGVQVVEGRVSDFRPMPWAGHAMERFCIEGHCFEYSDFDKSSGGFNNTSSHGGPIRDGLPVRVSYVGGTIVKLEVAP